jgi:pimeloyl-ACP methyl ester carboxylesterase
MTFQTRTVLSGDVRVHCVSAGPADGPLAVFFTASQLAGPLGAALAREGVPGRAPNLRGYGESDRPAGLDSYSVSRFVEGVLAIVDAGRRPRVAPPIKITVR